MCGVCSPKQRQAFVHPLCAGFACGPHVWHYSVDSATVTAPVSRELSYVSSLTSTPEASVKNWFCITVVISGRWISPSGFRSVCSSVLINSLA
eukprot:m.965411 g.965411  ORF g.965411 m.965411 type:complete len:93 (+) comp23909_c0_seq15:1082-1360(+)